MSHETTKKMIAEKRSSQERLESLEKLFPNLLRAIGKQMDELNTKQKAIEEMLDAVIGVLGVDNVSAALLDARTKRATAEAEKQKEETSRLVEQGVLVPEEVVGPDSVVVASEVKADGTPAGPGWYRFHMTEMEQSFRDRVLGQTVGSTGSFENGNVYTILNVYKVDQSKIVANAATTPTAEA